MLKPNEVFFFQFTTVLGGSFRQLWFFASFQTSFIDGVSPSVPILRNPPSPEPTQNNFKKSNTLEYNQERGGGSLVRIDGSFEGFKVSQNGPIL
jgi:hypothetical protein